jgi:hypothetical protein
MVTARTGNSATDAGNSASGESRLSQSGDLSPPGDLTGLPYRSPAAELADAPCRSHPPERVTIALIPKAGEDLQRLHDRTGLSKTDIVNRALTLYEFIAAQLAAGRDVLIRDNSTREVQAVLLL